MAKINSAGGKGSASRIHDYKAFGESHDRIFGKKKAAPEPRYLHVFLTADQPRPSMVVDITEGSGSSYKTNDTELWIYFNNGGLRFVGNVHHHMESNQPW